MQIGEIKIFKNTQELIEHYPYTNEKKDEVGHKHFIIPLQNQLKSFKDGLGKIYFFETKENSHCHEHVDTGKYNYLFHSEYVKILDYELNDSEINYLKADGFDDCFVGVGQSFGLQDRLIYDKNKMLEKMKKDGMTEEEAWEYFEYNILGAYISDNMPIFLSTCSLEELQQLEELEKIVP
jgi:hypothetical protein